MKFKLIIYLIFFGFSDSILADYDSLQVNQTKSIQNNLPKQSSDSTILNFTNESFFQNLNKIRLEYDSITAMTFDDKNRIWIGSKNGLWVFEGFRFHEYTYKDGLFDKEILDLYYSAKKQIWAATPTGPYALIDNHFYLFAPLKNQKILSISENTTNWLFMTEEGIRIFKKETGFFDILHVKISAAALLLIFLAALLSLGIKHFKNNVEWKANLIRVEHAALRAQMNPHFIFNSLNSVQRYIMANDKESAHTYLQKFASMMRKVLENSRKSTITLSEEIATLELYLQLEALRFDKTFDFEITVGDNELWQFEIPTMILQTFVENAVWHGLMRKEGRGKINLRFSKISKKFIMCEIEDNGIGRKKAAEYKSKDPIKHKSKGTAIVQKRIKLLNLKARQKITCETIDLEESKSHQTGTLVRLEIPIALT